MEANLTDGLTVSVIGIGTVFTALAALTVLVAGLLRFGGPRPESEKRAPAPAEASAADQSPSPESHAERADEEAVDLTAIAVAAYGAHRRHRVDPGSAKPIGDWVHAGRIRASAPFQR